MVNENIKTIIENKKPIELVQEAKNEVPSFEEFMKTYESEEGANYADLSGGDIGEIKGHGPCTDGRYWRDCHCSDSEVLRQLNSAIHNINNGVNIQININKYNSITQIINKKNIKVTITLPPITQVFSLTLSVLPREFITLNSSREYRVGSG